LNRAVRQQPEQAPGGDRERYMHRERNCGTGEHEGRPVPAAHDQAGQHGLIRQFGRQHNEEGCPGGSKIHEGTHQVGPTGGPGTSGTAVCHCGRRSHSDHAGPRGPGPVYRAEIVGLPAMELLPFAASHASPAAADTGTQPHAPPVRDGGDKDAVTGASVVSTLTLNSSGFSITTVSPAGSPVAESSNLIVTVITGCPGDNRRLRAMDGCGGLTSTLTAAAGSAVRVDPNEGSA